MKEDSADSDDEFLNEGAIDFDQLIAQEVLFANLVEGYQVGLPEIKRLYLAEDIGRAAIKLTTIVASVSGLNIDPNDSFHQDFSEEASTFLVSLLDLQEQLMKVRIVISDPQQDTSYHTTPRFK